MKKSLWLTLAPAAQLWICEHILEKTMSREGGVLLTLIFTEDAWEYAKNHARAITINQEQCRG